MLEVSEISLARKLAGRISCPFARANTRQERVPEFFRMVV